MQSGWPNDLAAGYLRALAGGAPQSVLEEIKNAAWGVRSNYYDYRRQQQQPPSGGVSGGGNGGGRTITPIGPPARGEEPTGRSGAVNSVSYTPSGTRTIVPSDDFRQFEELGGAVTGGNAMGGGRPKNTGAGAGVGDTVDLSGRGLSDEVDNATPQQLRQQLKKLQDRLKAGKGDPAKLKKRIARLSRRLDNAKGQNKYDKERTETHQTTGGGLGYGGRLRV
jgi:hypothetical protein